jgi:hypothetical protein
MLEFTPRGSGRPVVVRAEGQANEWVSLRATFGPLDFDDATDALPVHTQPTKAKKKHKKGRRK